MKTVDIKSSKNDVRALLHAILRLQPGKATRIYTSLYKLRNINSNFFMFSDWTVLDDWTEALSS